jgi:hypothetical protein
MREPMLVDTPALFPGACVDGRQNGPVVATFVQLPGWGEVYLSREMLRDCVRLLPGTIEELAGERGMVYPAELEARLARVEAELAEKNQELAELLPITSLQIRRALQAQEPAKRKAPAGSAA